MGTRADFYVGRGMTADWLGSIAWSGCPGQLMVAAPDVFRAADEAGYRIAIAALLSSRDDATVPADGWPWPWNSSHKTDYAYAFDGGRVLASPWGRAWFVPGDDEGDESGPTVATFAAMDTSRSALRSPRSGLVWGDQLLGRSQKLGSGER